MDVDILEKAVALRHQLHEFPELSGDEKQTKKTLMTFLKENTGLEIVDKGQWFYAKYTAKEAVKGKIAFRADMDAIKIDEDDSLPYASKNPGAAHKCGHDGHSSALCAFAAEVDKRGADRDVCFVFQHAEETAGGAVVADDVVEEEGIEEMFGLHNYPGAPFGSVNTRPGTINLASVGLEFSFTGVSTHASTPELGRNPAKAIGEMILSIDSLAEQCGEKGILFATVIQVQLGERAFGVSAHEGKLLLTARGEYEAELDALINGLEALAKEKSAHYGLELELNYYDRFPETYNAPESVTKIKAICERDGTQWIELEEPIRTSEDFGYFLKKTKGALIWLGAGEDAAPLHSKDFDYNDGLIEKTSKLFWELLEA